jgi:protease-4
VKRAFGLARVAASAGLALVVGSLAACAAPEEANSAPITESLLELDLTDALPEQGAGFLGEKRPGLADATLKVRELLDEPLTKGLFVRIGPHAGHFADVDEWAAAFEAYREKKKPVHCQFDSLDNAGYALAAHCDRLSMTPAGTLELVGLAAQVVYGKALLELLGVQADLLQMGKYKGAAEPFTRDDISPELRESLDGLLNDFDARFREHLVRRLGGTPEQAAKLVAAGPYTAASARKAGLIDAIAYDDEARAKAKSAAGARVVKKLFEPKGSEKLSLRDLLDALAGDEGKPKIDRPHLALAVLKGEIVDSEREAIDQMGGTPFVSALRKLGNDPQVRAVVLRIESPGGSALASDRMWHAVRRVAKRKPVIVSLGDVAASGGYYVASAGTRIVAEPGSLVGSIGVVGGKMVVRGLADKVGVHVDTLQRGPHAGWLSPFAPFSDTERKLFGDLLRDTYDRFLARVSEGRKKPIAEILPAAEGRVMGGERAKAMGLVDEVGGLHTAFALARKAGNLPKDAPITVWPDEPSPLRALGQLMGGAKAQQGVLEGAEVVEFDLAHSLTQGALVSVLLRQREPVAATLPFALELH